MAGSRAAAEAPRESRRTGAASKARGTPAAWPHAVWPWASGARAEPARRGRPSADKPWGEGQGGAREGEDPVRGRRWLAGRGGRRGRGGLVRGSTRALPTSPPKCSRTLGSNRQAAEIRTCAQLCVRAPAPAGGAAGWWKLVGRAPERPSDRKCAPGVRREGGSGFIKGLVRLRVEGVTSLPEGRERSGK